MSAILQAVFSWPALLLVIAVFLVVGVCLMVKKHPKILLGCYQLLESPSGVFGLLTLFAITFVTLKQPTVGGVAFAAFVSIVPSILAWTEHKETMATLLNPPVPPAASPADTAHNLPSRGQL